MFESVAPSSWSRPPTPGTLYGIEVADERPRDHDTALAGRELVGGQRCVRRAEVDGAGGDAAMPAPEPVGEYVRLIP